MLTASDWGNLSKLSYQWFTWGLISPFTVNFWKLFLLIGVYVFNLVVMENFGVVSLQSPQYHHWFLTCRSHPMDSKNKLSSLSTAMFSHENTTLFYWTLLQWKDKANNFLPCLLIKPWVLSKNSFRLDHFVFFKNENWTKWRSCWPACIIKF